MHTVISVLSLILVLFIKGFDIYIEYGKMVINLPAYAISIHVFNHLRAVLS